RTVEAIDKKHNFPVPSVRQRKLATSTDEGSAPSAAAAAVAHKPSTSAAPRTGKPSDAGASSSADTGKFSQQRRVGDAVAQGIGAEKEREEEKVISPELRALLSRKVPKLDKKEVLEHGGGIN
ncbi:GTPase activating protein, partial [Cryomyces antarcticus]